MTDINIDRVRRLVCDQSATYQAARRCCDDLNGVATSEIRRAKATAGDLRRIYSVRLARPPRGEIPSGSDDLLQRLEAADSQVDTYVWERGGMVFCVITNADATKLVACIVGRDRRAVEAKES
jgi:hypothetical protein